MRFGTFPVLVLRNYLRRNYTICEKYFDESDWSYERDHPNLVGMCISTVLTEEMMIVPDEINITLKNHKYLFRAKIKSDASKSSTAAKGATNTSISLAEAQKKIAKLLTTRTIIASFDPTLHMHLLNVTFPRTETCWNVLYHLSLKVRWNAGISF